MTSFMDAPGGLCIVVRKYLTPLSLRHRWFDSYYLKVCHNSNYLIANDVIYGCPNDTFFRFAGCHSRTSVRDRDRLRRGVHPRRRRLVLGLGRGHRHLGSGHRRNRLIIPGKKITEIAIILK